ncbi:MAG: nucleotidyl transferase AbiEii/AbiGii toxin family protein [Bdellovibrionota bacterium]
MKFVHDDKDFGDLLRIVAGERKLGPGLVEKDYWITHALWALGDQGFDIWFKGGTSLSKGFRLIRRFSEDLDLKIEPGTVRGIPSGINWKSEGAKAVKAREEYFDALARKIAIPGTTLKRDGTAPDELQRNANFQAIYPGRYAADLPPPMKPFVLLEVGNARIAPSVERDMASFVHEYLEGRGQLAGYEDNRPRKVRCVHPLVTLLEKLDALHRRVPREGVEPATFVRHFEDAATIIRKEKELPPLEGYEDMRALAAEMKESGQIKELPSAADPAWNLAPGARMEAIEEAWGAIAPIYWEPGARISLNESCRIIREWAAANFP